MSRIRPLCQLDNYSLVAIGRNFYRASTFCSPNLTVASQNLDSGDWHIQSWVDPSEPFASRMKQLTYPLDISTKHCVRFRDLRHCLPYPVATPATAEIPASITRHILSVGNPSFVRGPTEGELPIEIVNSRQGGMAHFGGC